MKFIPTAFLGCSLIAFSMTAAAQGNSNGVPNTEKFTAKFALTPTPDAPEKAKGKADIKSDIREGTGSGALSLQAQGLDPGDYTVDGVLAGGGSVPLASFTNGDPNNTNNTRHLKSVVQTDLPTDVDPAEITQIIVSDSGGTAMLTGDLLDPAGKSKATLNALVPLIPGPAAPDASGFAKLKSSIKKGARKDNFVLIASGVPADATFTVDVDGTDGGTAASNSKGKVLVKELPAGLVTIGTVRLLDEGGAEVVRAEF